MKFNLYELIFSNYILNIYELYFLRITNINIAFFFRNHDAPTYFYKFDRKIDWYYLNSIISVILTYIYNINNEFSLYLWKFIIYY